ncbi:MAG: NAD-dependent epimerase/dehydratase family protein, partial [Paracoccus sp. (in: a-proteobacteria)]|nr:NAD-dependent epimerase/dehydratase family protein [Paracoccus sp. (in: a-proteobacteria)]
MSYRYHVTNQTNPDSLGILVTGGAGFIGSHLCRRLLEEGKKIVCLDSFQSGRRENVEELLDSPNFTLIEQDVIEPISGQFDQFYNLACPASPPRYQQDPIHTLKTSVIGMDNVLRCALQNNARVLQASTSEIYG